MRGVPVLKNKRIDLRRRGRIAFEGLDPGLVVAEALGLIESDGDQL